MTTGESTKFLKEISAIIRNAKKVPNKSKEDTNKKSEDQVLKISKYKRNNINERRITRNYTKND